MTHALLSIVLISVVLTNIITGVCVNNLSSRAIHCEVYDRGGIFPSTFSKKVNTHSTECCDSENTDCRYGTYEDAVFWVDCDTNKRTKQGFGQAIVACAKCNITVDDSGLIVVADEDATKGTRAVYTCKF